MYVDELNQKISMKNGVELDELPTSPDPAAGLYIKSRTGQTVKVGIPRDALAFQTGEGNPKAHFSHSTHSHTHNLLALEVITEGKFKAVPHFVRGCRASMAPGVSRNTIAVFTREFIL